LETIDSVDNKTNDNGIINLSNNTNSKKLFELDDEDYNNKFKSLILNDKECEEKPIENNIRNENKIFDLDPINENGIIKSNEVKHNGIIQDEITQNGHINKSNGQLN